MATLAELQADLEALKALRRTGALRVSIEGRDATFRSDAEIVAAIGALEEEISGGAGPRNVIVRSRKGW